MNTDHIFIKQMELLCRIGTTDEERAFPQILLVSVRIYLSLVSAGETDALIETIDYAEIIKKIRTHTQQRKYALAEAVATDVAEIALTPLRAIAVDVEINKKVFEGINAVGVFIRREKAA